MKLQSDQEQYPESRNKLGRFYDFWMRHKLNLLIVMIIVVAFILTMTSMWLYYKSGAAELDLSRPGYEAVRKDTAYDRNTSVEYSEQGSFTASDRDEFLELYDQQRSNLDNFDRFESDVFSDDSLDIFSDFTVGN